MLVPLPLNFERRRTPLPLLSVLPSSAPCVAIEYRWAERHDDRLVVLANELILKAPRPLAAHDNEALRCL